MQLAKLSLQAPIQFFVVVYNERNMICEGGKTFVLPITNSLTLLYQISRSDTAHKLALLYTKKPAVPSYIYAICIKYVYIKTSCHPRLI